MSDRLSKDEKVILRDCWLNIAERRGWSAGAREQLLKSPQAREWLALCFQGRTGRRLDEGVLVYAVVNLGKASKLLDPDNRGAGERVYIICLDPELPRRLKSGRTTQTDSDLLKRYTTQSPNATILFVHRCPGAKESDFRKHLIVSCGGERVGSSEVCDFRCTQNLVVAAAKAYFT